MDTCVSTFIRLFLVFRVGIYRKITGRWGGLHVGAMLQQPLREGPVTGGPAEVLRRRP